MHLLAQLLPHSPSGKYLTEKTVPAKNLKIINDEASRIYARLSALQIQRIFFSWRDYHNLLVRSISQEYFVLSMPFFKLFSENF